MNNVNLTGRTTQDVILKYTANGIGYVLFNLAVTRKFKDQNGEYVTDFIPCVAWNKQAEYLSKYVAKGNLIEVTGEIQQRTYQTQSGENRNIIEVVLDSVKNLTPKPKQEQTPQQFQPTYQNPFDNVSDHYNVNNDDLPF